MECYQLVKGTCAMMEVCMCVESTQVSKSERYGNVPECYQLEKRTCTALEVQIAINDSNFVYKL